MTQKKVMAYLFAKELISVKKYYDIGHIKEIIINHFGPSVQPS
jgi:hypothetical protein